MDYKELRLGNLVKCDMDDTYNDRKPYYGKCIFDIVQIGVDHVKVNLGFGAVQQLSLSEIKPIKLTENLMERFGMHEQHYAGVKMFYHDIFWPIRLDVKTKKYSIEELEIKELKYAHRLQNLFFEFTRKELPIKAEINPTEHEQTK